MKTKLPRFSDAKINNGLHWNTSSITIVYLVRPFLFLFNLRLGHFLKTENDTPSKNPMITQIRFHIIYHSKCAEDFYHK